MKISILKHRSILIRSNKPKHFFFRPGKIFVLFLLVHVSIAGFSQTNESSKEESHLSGSILVTNNGISLIPSFNLGKPAMIFNLSMGNEKLSFEPELRFALEGKPWTFIFWGRYKLIENKKFQMRIGAHPSFVFKEINIEKDGIPMDIIRARRYLAGEIYLGFQVSEHVRIMPYYLYGYGIEKDITRNTHYIALQSSFSNIKLSDGLYMGFTPQIYYLKMDKLDGYYVASGISLAKKEFPFTVSAMMTKIIKSEIASDDFIWSLSLIYSFGNTYIRK